MMEIVASVNVACGMHAGDPTVMHRVVVKAKERGVSIGAHPGFSDLVGFGRRRIDMAAADLEYLIAYQIGALSAVAAYAGLKVTHVKPHGALHAMAAANPDYAMAIGRAIRAVDRDAIYLVTAGSEMEAAAQRLDLPLAREAFVDRVYDDDGALQSRAVAGAVITDAKVAAERCVRLVETGEIVSAGGKRIPLRFDSLCVHGDEPTAVAVAGACRSALEAAGIAVVALPDMLS
ncbi:hypothetical protein BVIRIDIS_16990 [Blastochloris viridis]|nr:hypothetical protein BVIRIDIS_16990 [Blastochloris viridis]